MSWTLPVAALLLWLAVVVMALRSEHRSLVTARARVQGPPPTRGELIRAALLPSSWVRWWGGICGLLCLLPLMLEAGIDPSLEGMPPLMMGVVGLARSESAERALWSGRGPDGRPDPGWFSPSPEAGTLWHRGRGVFGVTVTALLVAMTLWFALTLQEPPVPWWKLVVLLVGLPSTLLVAYLLRLALPRVHLRGGWIRVIHHLHVTHVPVERVVRVEGRELRLNDGRVVRTGVDLDADRITRFVEPMRVGVPTEPPRDVERERELPANLAFFWVGLFMFSAP